MKTGLLPELAMSVHERGLSQVALPGRVDPGVDVGGVEADEVAPLDVGDAAFVDEAANVADLDAEALCDGRDVDEVADGLEVVHGAVSWVSVVSFHSPAKRVTATKRDKESGKSPQSLWFVRPQLVISVRHVPPKSDHDLTLSVDS